MVSVLEKRSDGELAKADRVFWYRNLRSAKFTPSILEREADGERKIGEMADITVSVPLSQNVK